MLPRALQPAQAGFVAEQSEAPKARFQPPRAHAPVPESGHGRLAAFPGALWYNADENVH